MSLAVVDPNFYTETKVVVFVDTLLPNSELTAIPPINSWSGRGQSGDDILTNRKARRKRN